MCVLALLIGEGLSFNSPVKLRPLDFIFFFLAIFAVAFCFRGLFRSQSGKSVLTVQSRNQKWIYPLDENREFSVEGLLGETKVVIKDGGAFFAASPCENKTCLSEGKISRRGMWIACLPNGVFAMVEGGESQFDAMSF